MFNEKEIISKWIADMYDQDITESNDVEFALSVLGDIPKNVLEIACGSGRILVPIAKAGHYATGLDFDEYMLEKIKNKATELKNIKWHKSDVITNDWGNNFDVVMLAGNFLFNIVSDKGYEQAQEMLIEKSAQALIKGGHIYIDYGYTLHPERWFGNPNENVVWNGKDNSGNYGKMTLLNSTYNSETGMNSFIRRFELTLVDGTKINQELYQQKHFATLEQIHNWLEKYSFAIAQEYGDYEKNPISENTNRAIIWARKI